jgi:hypothetical protein
VLNKLPAEALHGADRLLAWLLILFGYVIALAMVFDRHGWDDPVFTVIRAVPYTQYSWAALLTVGILVYTVGEVMRPGTERRGVILCAGAMICFTWAFAMSAAMARMVYQMPERITILWPLVMFFVACLYATRIVVYSDAFTGERWNTNPYQLWGTTGLVSASLSQVIIGVAPSSILTEAERPVTVTLALANLLGATMTMVGLHLKNTNLGLNLEFAGTISLVATLAWYVETVLTRQILAGTTVGFALAEFFLFATLHRAVQILIRKWAQWRGHPALEAKMTQQLRAETIPPMPIEPDEILPPRQRSRHRGGD